MRYEGTVYRPPSEAGSLIIQATIGCPHNRCAFCGMYSDKHFKARPRQKVIEDLDLALETYGPDIRTIFLADGNSAVLSTARLVEIGQAAQQRFPNLKRITTYGSAKFLVKKSLDEWAQIREAGITRIHSGLESGDPETLEAIDKGMTAEQAVTAFNHVIGAGLELSVYLMIGIAGSERSVEHAKGSREVLNQASPDFIRLRTFVPIVGTPWHDRWREGLLTLLTAHEAVAETRLLIEGLEGPTHVLSDHMSNFVNVHGNLPDDKMSMLQLLDDAAEWPQSKFRPPTESLVGMML